MSEPTLVPGRYPRLSTGALRSARRLLRRKGRQEAGQFIAEGAQAVREALREPGRVRLLVVDHPDRHAELIAMAVPDVVREADAGQLKQLSDTVTPQGVLAICDVRPARLEDVSEPRLAVICAQIRDPGNAGTVIRCADAFGADAVLLSADSVELHNPKTVRASVGSLFHLPVVSGVGVPDAIAWAKQVGLRVLAADASGRGLDELENDGTLSRPTAWLMGNEAWGLPAEHLALVDEVVRIPMWGLAESLNLSTAAAVCLYATARAQRRPTSQNASEPSKSG